MYRCIGGSGKERVTKWGVNAGRANESDSGCVDGALCPTTSQIYRSRFDHIERREAAYSKSN